MTLQFTQTFTAPAECVGRAAQLGSEIRERQVKEEDLIMQPLEARGESSALSTLLPPPLCISYSIHL